MNQKTEIKCSNCVHGITFKKRDDEPSNMGCNESDWAGYTTDEKPSCNGEFFYPKKTMTLKEYQIEAHKTAIYPQDKAREYLSLGLVSEIGELCGVKKKFLRGDFGDEEYKRRVMSEVGDVAWYLVEMMTHLGLNIDGVYSKRSLNNTSYICWKVHYFLESITSESATELLTELIAFAGLSLPEFYTSLEQNIAKLQARQKNGALRGDGEGVRQ